MCLAHNLDERSSRYRKVCASRTTLTSAAVDTGLVLVLGLFARKQTWPNLEIGQGSLNS